MDAPPQLSLFAFHLEWPGATLAEQNAATEQLMARVTARGSVMLTGCTVGGRYLGRVCVLSFRTHDDTMRVAYEHTAEETERLVREFRARGTNAD
jgi:aromatic-L-amino-acid decarboxylase